METRRGPTIFSRSRRSASASTDDRVMARRYAPGQPRARPWYISAMNDTQLVSADEVRTIAVLGAGTMGHGIAQVAAMAGFDVILRDIAPELVDRGLSRIQANLDQGVARGKVTEQTRA